MSNPLKRIAEDAESMALGEEGADTILPHMNIHLISTPAMWES